MNLISCNNCGVVLDLSNMDFITILTEEDNNTDIEWNGDCYHPVLPCPVCKSDVVNEEIKL